MRQCKCETCAADFESKVPRRFCSVKCRANHPEFKAIAARNAEKARAAKKPAATRACQHCGKAFECMPSRSTRFCSRSCYRAWSAAMFDNHIAMADKLPALQGFDEFLNRDILHCPMPGCDWQGEDLGHHAGMAHGIPAAVLKERCGFNSSTGLVGRRLAMRLSQRARDTAPFSLRGRGPAPGAAAVLRPEAQEHFDKYMTLRRCTVAAKEGAMPPKDWEADF